MIVLRVFIGIVVLAIVAVATVPLFVLLDLVGGGDGWGLCPDGLSSCESGYFVAPEMVAVLLVAMAVLLGVLRVAVVIDRRMRQDRRPTVTHG